MIKFNIKIDIFIKLTIVEFNFLTKVIIVKLYFYKTYYDMFKNLPYNFNKSYHTNFITWNLIN